MLEAVSLGIILGLTAGFSPGPLLTLVLTETLQHNIRAGIKIAVSPVLTDLPIILLSLFLLSRVSHSDLILGLISIAGGCFILHMGIETIKVKSIPKGSLKKRENSLLKGVIANLLSPHPYLFWITVGGPTISSAMNRGVHAAIGFVAAFYLLLIGSKISLAFITAKSSALLTEKRYRYIMLFLGICLCILSVLLFYDGAKLFGFLS